MKNLTTANIAFANFRKFAEQDRNYFVFGRTGIIEEVLAYFGLPIKPFKGASSSVHEDHLEVLQKFLLHYASKEQIEFVMKISQGAKLPTVINDKCQAFGRVFVSMPMNKAKYDCVDVIRDGTCKAITETGNEPYYLDLDTHNENICRKMIDEIQMCKFLVADFTYQNPGVYYEAGYARGIGKTVIHTCRKDEINNLHFDIIQTQHVKWETEEDLAAKLKQHISLSGLGKEQE